MPETFVELKAKAEGLRKEKKHIEALAIYEKLWKDYRKECGKWEGWGLAFCYKNLKRYDEALKTSREVYNMDKAFDMNNNVYAWSIYYTQILKEDEEIASGEPTFLKAAIAIVDLVKQDKFSPKTRTVMKVLDYLKGKNNKQYDVMLEWAEKLDHTVLSEDCFKYKDEEGKDREMACDKEKWYSIKTSALIKTGKFEECVKFCEEALASLKKFHYDNDKWFKMRIALCKWKLGEKDESHINEIKEILAQRKEWFLQYDLAEFFHDIGKDEEAMKYALDSALNFGDPDKKGKVFMMLAGLLKVKGMNELAGKHVLLAYSFILSEKRKNSEQTKAMLKEYGVSVPTASDSRALLNELKIEWSKLKGAVNEVRTGRITRYMTKEPGREFGFIKDDKDSIEYYFRIKAFRGDKKKVAIGLKVKYFLEDGYDKKKEKASKNAVNIQEAN